MGTPAFTWTASVDGIRISLDALPIAICIALALVAAGLSVVSARRIHPLLMAIATTGGVVVGLIAFASSSNAITSASVASIAAACTEVLVTACVVAGIGGAVALLAAIAIGAHLIGHLPKPVVDGAPNDASVEESRPHWTVFAAGALAAVLATASVVGTFLVSDGLRTAGAIPRVESRGCAQVHVGLTCVPRLKPYAHNRVFHERKLLFFPTGRTFPKLLDRNLGAQRSFDDVSGWRIPAVKFDAVDKTRGSHSAQSVAVRSGIRVTRPLEFLVVDNKPDPRFSPEVGDAWRFARAQRHTQVHLFVFDSSTTTNSNAELRVTHSVVIDGLHAVVVTRKGFEAEASFVVAGVDGTALFRPFGDDTAAWKKLIESEDAPFPDLPPNDVAQLTEAGVGACKIGMLPPSSCACFKNPIDAAREKAGPLFCRLRSRDNGIGTVLLAVLTLGLVIEGTDRPVYTLISSGPHEDDATSDAPDEP